MNNICRMCLNYSLQEMAILSEETEILAKARASLSLPIKIANVLPNKMCQNCYRIIQDFCNFKYIVTQNQNILQQHLQDKTLNSFYGAVTDKAELKDEKNNLDSKENINYNNVIHNGTDIPTKTDVTIKDEIYFLNTDMETLTYSSDELTLAALKADVARVKNKKCSKKRNKVKIKKEVTLKENTTSDKLFFPEGTPDDQKKWKCLTCFDVFDKRGFLRNHYKREHYLTKSKDDAPITVDKEFSLVTLEGVEMYKCMRCDKTFDSKRLINRHLVSHIEDRPFVCNICGRTYKALSEIIQHGRVHSGFKPLACRHDQCGYSTNYYGALKAHEKRHCPDQFKYTCDKCGKGFNVKTWYDQHQNIHTGQKPFVCDICGNAFHMDRYLKTHRSTCHPQASNRRLHVCVRCGISCDNRTVLNSHMKEHGIGKSFLCDICGKSLLSAERLKFHRRMHLGEKPYSCSTCGKAFVKKSNLNLHERVHSGEKPHVCSHCGKAFSQKSTLVVHTRYHTGSRPYQCKLCPKSFVSKSRLSTHEKACM